MITVVRSPHFRELAAVEVAVQGQGELNGGHRPGGHEDVSLEEFGVGPK
jgi:hypothetical protein